MTPSVQQPLKTVMQAAFNKFLGSDLQANHKPVPTWNASLSYNTYNSLKRQGIM